MDRSLAGAVCSWTSPLQGTPRSVVVSFGDEVLIGGDLLGGSPPRPVMAITRLTPTGALDASFGKSGIFRLSPGPIDTQAQVPLLQSDHRIVAAGTSSGGLAGIVRLISNGTLDASYGDRGFVRDLPDAKWTAGLLQPDGKLVVAGVQPGGSHEFVVARVTVDGSTGRDVDLRVRRAPRRGT